MGSATLSLLRHRPSFMDRTRHRLQATRIVMAKVNEGATHLRTRRLRRLHRHILVCQVSEKVVMIPQPRTFTLHAPFQYSWQVETVRTVGVEL